MLSRFIDIKNQDEFWNLIKDTNGVIFGGVVWLIMMAGNAVYYDSCPPQIDIVISYSVNAYPLWKTFLAKVGYTIITAMTQKGTFEYSTKTIQSFTQPV
jgi:hypothetical protein